VGQLLERNHLSTEGCGIWVNGIKSDKSRQINDSDVIEIKPDDIEKKDDGIEKKEHNPLETIETSETVKILEAGAAGHSKGFVITVNGKQIALQDGKKYIFVDIFTHINFDISKHQGNIVLRLNGRQAAFTDMIKPGDVIDIYWEK